MVSASAATKTSLRAARDAWLALLDLVYPPICLACGQRHPSDTEVALCRDCLEELETIGPDACPRCGQGLGAHTAGRKACPTRHAGLIFRGAVAVCPYHSTAEHIVKALKFGRDMRALEIMAPMLAERAASAPFAADIEVVVPVPLHWRRRMARRFNQSELIAERVARRLGADFEPRGLARLRHTLPQAMLAPQERESSLRGAFGIRERGCVRGARVLLVDDVMTTCSTAKECALALREGGARSTDVAVFCR